MERKNMKKLLVALALIAGAAVPARAGIYYDLTQSASSATLRMVGAFKMYAASMGAAPSLSLDSVTGSMTASSATFTATGSSNYAVTTTTGVYVGGANTGVVAYFFKALGAFYGNLIGNVTGNLTGNVTGNVTGTAATITGNVTESQVTNLTTDLAAKASTGTNIDITSINALGVSKSSPVFTGTFGIGGSPSGTRKFQVYFNANNNSPSYGDGAVRYLDSVNGVGFECGALYGGSQPSWCQSGNDGMGSKKPFVFQPDGSNVGIRTLSPATTAALEVAGPVSVGGSGNTQYSLQASSGASFGSDLHVTGTLEATKLKGDGSQITGIGGGGTVTTQGSPAAGQVAVFQAGTVLSTGAASVTLGSTGSTLTITGMANFEVMIASQDVFGVTIATFDATYLAFASSTPYRLTINLTHRNGATAGGFFLNFSTDTAGRGCDYNSSSPGYGVNSYGFNSTAGGSGLFNAGPYNAIPLYYDGAATNQLTSGQNTRSRNISFETIEGSSLTWSVEGRGVADYSTVGIIWNVHGRYNGTKPITGLCITGSTGYFNNTVTKNVKFDAHLEIWRGPSHQ
jgi:hypothetical protein